MEPLGSVGRRSVEKRGRKSPTDGLFGGGAKGVKNGKPHKTVPNRSLGTIKGGGRPRTLRGGVGGVKKGP